MEHDSHADMKFTRIALPNLFFIQITVVFAAKNFMKHEIVFNSSHFRHVLLLLSMLYSRQGDLFRVLSKMLLTTFFLENKSTRRHKMHCQTSLV